MTSLRPYLVATNVAFLLFYANAGCGDPASSTKSDPVESAENDPGADRATKTEDPESSMEADDAARPTEGSDAGSSTGVQDAGSTPKDAGSAAAAKDASSNPDATTVAKASPAAVKLGAASDFVILAKSGVSTVPTSAVTGNVGVSPAAASAITGFGLIADASNVFALAPQVTGKVYAADYAAPTASTLTTAVSDMLLASTDAEGRAADVTELGAGNIGGMTLAPGVYKWTSSLQLPTDVTLSGTAQDVWIFQIAKDLVLSSGAKVVLAGGALAQNVFWQVSGLVDLGTTAHCEGIILSHTAVTLKTGASVHGRLLAQTAVALDANIVLEPAK
jgi:Ice-binding-like